MTNTKYNTALLTDDEASFLIESVCEYFNFTKVSKDEYEANMKIINDILAKIEFR